MIKKNWISLALLALLATGGATPLPAADEARQAYDQMVEEATREADEYLEEKTRQRSEQAQDSQPTLDPAFAEQVQAERERIETEMDTVRQRGLGPDFTLGMKENRLKELQEKLNQLLSDPQAYFGE